MQKFFTLLLSVILLGCSTMQDKVYPVRPLVMGTENGCFDGDIRLSYTDSVISGKGVIYKVNALYNNKNVGFELYMPPPMFAGFFIRSIGVESDNFLHELQKIYNQKIDTTAKFVDIIRADCLSMVMADSVEDSKGYVAAAENKLFFNPKSDSDDDYAELFLNINQTEHWIELKEKDSRYRPVIVKIFTKQ